MVPPLVRKVPFLAYPVDFGLKWKGKPLLGSHKTFRGLFFGVLVAVIVCYLQKVLFTYCAWCRQASLLDYSGLNFLLFGFLMGFGALFGDMVESLLKRRRGIGSGRPWIPWDQVDFVIGSLLFLAIVFVPSWQTIVFLLIVVPLLHIATNHIGFYLGINKSKW